MPKLAIMKNEDRIVELLAEMVKGQDRLTHKVSGMTNEISGMTNMISGMKREISIEFTKLNLNTAENSRAILKIAERNPLSSGTRETNS